MKRFKKEIIRSIILGLASITLTNCTLTSIECQKHKLIKEGKIPPNTFWNGGKDGGEWVCIELLHDSLVVINTYHEYLFEPNASFIFSINCKDISIRQIKKAFMFSTGINVIWDNALVPKKCLERIDRENINETLK